MTTYTYKTQPMAHQVEGLNRLIANDGVLGLLWEPGVGKTKAVIDYLGVMTQAKGTFLALVLAPLSAVDTWSDEIDKHLPDHIERTVVMLRGSIASKAKQLTVAVRDRGPGLTLIVTNHDVLSSSATVAGTKTVTNRQRMGDAIRGAGLDILVVDESHRAKGHSSNLSRSLGALSSAAPRRVIMTGTVAPHSPLDLFGQWRFLNPRRFGTVWNDFRERYATMGGFRGKQVIGYRHLDEMNRLAAMDSMTVRRRDVLDLPPVTENVIHVHLTPAEARAYKAMAKDMVIDHTSDGQPLLASTGLVKWLRLRQLTSGHYTDAEHHRVEHFGSSKVRMCVDKVSDLVAAGEKVVVFAHFRDDVFRTAETLRATLKDSAVVEHITGDTPQDERKAIRKTFLNHDGPVVVVAQMRTVSLAVNEFVVARHAVFMSMSERRDDWVQAKDRLDRNGQTRPVTLHYLVVPNSIDEVVLDTHRTKGRLEDAVVRNADRIKTLGENSD